MSLRPAKCYRKPHRPYTRQSKRKPKKGYVKGVPRPKISIFEMGKKDEYEIKVFLVSKNYVQIRHNALEAARVSIVQKMEKTLGKGGPFFFRVRPYPHHVLRENALATGAGADRFQQGMRSSFGKPIGTAARVKTNQKVFEIQVNKEHEKTAKEAMKRANHKLPTKTKIIIESAS